MGTYTAYIGIFLGICTALALSAQLLKMTRQKRPSDISYYLLILLVAGLGGWIWYGIVHVSYLVVFTNGFSFIVNLLIIYFSMKYKAGTKTGVIHEKNTG